MNHLPLLLLVVVLIAAGIFMVVGGGGEPDGPRVPPTAAPPNGTPEPATPPTPSTPSSPKQRSPHQAEAETVDGADDAKSVDITRKIEQLVFEDVGHAEAFEEIGRRLGCEVSFTDEAWKLVGSSSGVALHVEDISAQTILDLLTEPYGVVYRVEGNVLWILLEGEAPPETER